MQNIAKNCKERIVTLHTLWSLDKLSHTFPWGCIRLENLRLTHRFHVAMLPTTIMSIDIMLLFTERGSNSGAFFVCIAPSVLFTEPLGAKKRYGIERVFVTFLYILFMGEA